MTSSPTGAVADDDLAAEMRPASAVLGTEIVGLDVRDTIVLDQWWDRLMAELRSSHLLLFRGQDLEVADMDRFARRLGAFERSITQRPDGTASEPVHLITNLDREGRPSQTPFRNSNYFWHSDKAFLPNGSAMVLLHGIELPPQGGDTQFANSELAYDALSDAQKTAFADLRVVHSFEYMRNALMKRPLTDFERQAVPAPQAHPLVRTDPVTGRKSLFLGMYACKLLGMEENAGADLLDWLQDYVTQPRFVFTHQWRKGDFIVWNNLSLLHRALPNYAMTEHRRVMMRCGIRSEELVR